jgi:hypothetical protein
VSLGGDPAYWPQIAAALGTIPAPVQARMANVIGQVRVEGSIPVPPEVLAVTGGTVVGLYTPGRHGWADEQAEQARGRGNGLLELATEPDSADTVRHEAMHALDEADGYPSDKLGWRLLAHKIRKAEGRKSAPEFQSDGTGNDSRRAAEEMFAELAAQILGGQAHLNLDPVRGGKVFHAGPRPVLPPDLEAQVRAHMTSLGITPQGGAPS